MKKKRKQKDIKLRFEHDILVLLLGIIIAVVIVKTGILKEILMVTKGILFVDSFISGLFYTSGFTTPIAFVALSELAVNSSLLNVAFFGALGAVVGDVLIFKFLRDRIDKDIVFILKSNSLMKRVKAVFHLKLFRWVSFFIGGLILAAPLPDELGLAFMGLSKTKTWVFVIISFAFKFTSILLIVWIVKNV